MPLPSALFIDIFFVQLTVNRNMSSQLTYSSSKQAHVLGIYKKKEKSKYFLQTQQKWTSIPILLISNTNTSYNKTRPYKLHKNLRSLQEAHRSTTVMSKET